MNYQAHYTNLIEKAKKQVLPEETYVERHHILPVSIGGSNDPNNIVKLTARQHYFAHKLLVKIYEQKCSVPGTDKTPYYKMLRAFTAMIWFWGNSTKNMRKPNICSKMYEQWKLDLLVYNKQCHEKWWNSLSDEEKNKYSKKTSNSLKKHFEIYGSWWKGKTHSEETKKKIGKANSIQQLGKRNSQYGKHWWMNPETRESRSIKEGDPVPEGWIRGRCCKKS